MNQLRILVRESFYWLILHLTCLSVLLVPRSWEKLALRSATFIWMDSGMSRIESTVTVYVFVCVCIDTHLKYYAA